jgi:hypothetical protein
MEDDDVTQWYEWTDLERLLPKSIRVTRVGLAVDEQREQQAELFQRFATMAFGESSSDSPRVSASEDSDGDRRYAPLSGAVRDPAGARPSKCYKL